MVQLDSSKYRLILLMAGRVIYARQGTCSAMGLAFPVPARDEAHIEPTYECTQPFRAQEQTNARRGNGEDNEDE
jgi:hypothetical protein